MKTARNQTERSKSMVTTKGHLGYRGKGSGLHQALPSKNHTARKQQNISTIKERTSPSQNCSIILQKVQ